MIHQDDEKDRRRARRWAAIRTVLAAVRALAAIVAILYREGAIG